MDDTGNRIQRYYGADPTREWARLARLDTGPIEFELTKRHIARRLAPASRVIDVGGGPGRYAAWLAGQGHHVTLAELVPELVDEARRQAVLAGVFPAIEEFAVADACDLSRWQDESFDAALCLGPFYHLPEAARREDAAAELARILRPGGWLFVAFMPRLGFLRRTIAVQGEWAHLHDDAWLRGLFQEGVFLNDNPGRFDVGYGARPEEIGPFWERHGVTTERVLATEGISPILVTELEHMREVSPETYARALDLIEQTSAEPSILGLANHLLFIGTRR